jgi:hypothetical protein
VLRIKQRAPGFKSGVGGFSCVPKYATPAEFRSQYLAAGAAGGAKAATSAGAGRAAQASWVLAAAVAAAAVAL